MSAAPLPPLQVRAPWADTSTLQTLVWADLLDTESLPIDRAAAMQVPAMSRARHLLAGAIATCPLVGMQGTTQLDPGPLWLQRTDGYQSPWHRMLWTVDDLLFTGWSLWYTPRDTDGHVLTAARLGRDTWLFADDNLTVIDADTRVPLDSRFHTLIPGPHEGVLAFGARSLRTASRLERTIANHARNPVPSIELHQEEDVQLTDEEIDKAVERWVKARRSDNGSVAFTAYGIRAYQLGEVPEALLIDGRNSVAVDIARHASVPAASLDATSAGASLTYETTEGRNVQFLDYGASLYMDAITGRLSQDDVVPRGTRTAFDIEQLTATSRGATDPSTGTD